MLIPWHSSIFVRSCSAFHRLSNTTSIQESGLKIRVQCGWCSRKCTLLYTKVSRATTYSTRDLNARFQQSFNCYSTQHFTGGVTLLIAYDIHTISTYIPLHSNPLSDVTSHPTVFFFFDIRSCSSLKHTAEIQLVRWWSCSSLKHWSHRIVRRNIFRSSVPRLTTCSYIRWRIGEIYKWNFLKSPVNVCSFVGENFLSPNMRTSKFISEFGLRMIIPLIWASICFSMQTSSIRNEQWISRMIQAYCTLALIFARNICIHSAENVVDGHEENISQASFHVWFPNYRFWPSSHSSASFPIQRRNLRVVLSSCMFCV